MALAPVSAQDCEVMGTLRGSTRVGGSLTLTYKDPTLVQLLSLPFQRVIDGPGAVFKRQGLIQWLLFCKKKKNPYLYRGCSNLPCMVKVKRCDLCILGGACVHHCSAVAEGVK